MSKKTSTFNKYELPCNKFPDKCNQDSCKIYHSCIQSQDEPIECIPPNKGMILNPYSQTHLKEWLELDTWTAKEALLLMADLSPIGTDVKWEGKDEAFRGILVKKVKIINSLPLLADDFSDIMTFGQHSPKRLEEVSPEFAECFRGFIEYEDKLDRIKRLWDSQESSIKTNWDDEKSYQEERHPIEYYLKWAEKKNITIQWLPWAKRSESESLNVDDEKNELRDAKFKIAVLDTDHPFHANELKIAVEAWKELYEKNHLQYDPKVGHSRYIDKWLEKNHPSLSLNAKERIKIVIKPKRSESLNVGDEINEPLDAKFEIAVLNPKHPITAKELKIAIEAWQELYEKKHPLYHPKGGHKKYIAKWLKNNHPSLGSNALKRISVTINPKRKGGASRSNDKFK